MGLTVTEVLEFVEENDVKFIRLTFCNLFGVMKNYSIMPGELPDAFEKGVCVDISAVEGFFGEEDGDIFLHPDPNTLSILPWRPSHGRVVRLFCEMRRSDGSPCQGDGRYLLSRAVKRAREMGYACQMGCEVEFYLFQLDENGNPTMTPQDQAGYCDVAPLDKGENVRREICLALEDMGIQPESSHHERGPGQNEIACKSTDPLAAADALLNFRSLSGVVAGRNGLWACFLPKPLPDRDGSSLHVNLSLTRDGANLFRSGGGEHCEEAEQFMAGILTHYTELTAFLNPQPDSYLRMGPDIPARVIWSHGNRNQIIRIPASRDTYTRMELRSPDPSLNPYLAFSLLMEAGLDGIEHRLSLDREPAGEGDPLPADLGAAVELARFSQFVQRVIPPKALENYCEQKLEEYHRWCGERDA